MYQFCERHLDCIQYAFTHVCFADVPELTNFETEAEQ